MATIPIEVIVQDGPSPEPTPTPSDSGETNIVVPDTGVGTVENGSNGGGIGSATNIILPAIILILAIGAIVALLIRRQQRRKQSTIEADNNTRQERRALAATSTIAVLAAVVLLGQLVVSGIVAPLATNAATDETNTGKDGELVVDDKITITVTREASSNNTIVGSIENKSYATVYKSFGYEVAISMAGSNANLYLDGDESSSYYFSPVEDSTLADNTWGYSLDGEAGEYNAVPLVDDLAVVDKGATSVINEEIDIYYGIKVTNDMPAGTYTGELEYTLADTGFPVSLRSMQDMTADICSSVPTPNPFKADGTTIEDNVPTIMLKDVRDNKLYRVAKLADGKCWMTQNLDLQKEDLLDGVVLDSSNTDNPAEGFELPNSETSGSESWGSYGSEDAINTAHVYNIEGDTSAYRYCLEYYHGNCIEYSEEAIPVTNFGNYYNWYATTAGTGTFISNDDEIASGSICPAGWRLPNGGSSSVTDYGYLLYIYGILTNETSGSYDSEKLGILDDAPLSFVYSGQYIQGADITGDKGTLWTSTASANALAYYFSYAKDSLYLDSSGKFYGHTMRCLVK